MDYDSIAKSYNELYSEEQIKKLETIKKLIEIKDKYILLDIGCGTGISTNYFNCICFGVDNSFEMVSNGVGNLVNGNAENLPFKNKKFDIIICITAFHNFSDFTKAISEIKRVGKKDFKIIISVMKKSSNFNKIKKLIINNFKVKEYDEGKDVIFYG